MPKFCKLHIKNLEYSVLMVHKVHNKPYGSRTVLKWIAAAVIVVGSLTACEGYDLAKKDPAWLGSSIYEYLQSEGTFMYTVQLINDLGYAEVLAKTGSKTLFVADDAAYIRFFQNNTWGVSSYAELTLAQKKQLLLGSMINNACQVAYLSSSEGPTEGDCMRRVTAASSYDSVTVLKPEQMPDNPYWAYHRNNGRNMVCMTDITTPPMIHFIEGFLTNKFITNDDCNFLFNYTTARQAGDANINGVKMVMQNIKCSNGFVHRMAEVVTPLPNMAELINQKPNTRGWSKLLDRYCAPYYAGDEVTREYNRLYYTNIDSVFEKRYFSERSHARGDYEGSEVLEITPDEGPVNGLLKFDPGWNKFFSTTTTSTSTNVALQENMGVMLVPSDAALERYWNEGAGRVLKDYYGTWENVPDKVISKMLNVNMLNSFTNSVPSKFHTVLNDANDELGLKEEFVDSVYLACNGAIYLTNKVFNPVAYISVTFPALVDASMNILYWAVEQLGFDVYLNSQNTYYSLFIPNNNSLLEYIDPCSFGKTETQLFRFRYDPTALTERERVKGSIWNYDMVTRTVTDSIGEASYDQITNRLEDILNHHIVIGDVEDGNTFYQTKGGSMVKVKNASQGVAGMTVQGGMQIENGENLRITKIYDESREGNGKTYILDDSPIMTSRKSVFDILNDHEQFSGFRDLLLSSKFLETKHVIGTDEHATASVNISLFNTYRYTIYVPSNEAILNLQAAGKLPTWEMVEEEEDEEKRDSLTNEIENFIKYHIQDNAYYVGQGKVTGEFETSAYKIDEGNLSYYKLRTSVSNDGIQVTDGTGKTYNVVQTPGLYNIMAREYQYDAPDATMAGNIYTSSFAVVHLIDGALMYK